MMMIGNKFLYNNAYIFYIVGVILLILVLFLGKPINNARCWFIIPYIGSIQPSEFMKVFWIITLSRMINDFNEEYDNPEVSDELKFILKVLVLLLIPSILTYVEPDTGAVIMYLIITITMLFVGGFRKRWFVITILTIITLIGSILGISFLDRDLFIKLFGTSFFYRMDRILNWSNSTGLQLTNSMTAIGSAGLFGSIFLIMLITFFDITLITTVNKTTNYPDKYAIGGILAVLIFQQIYNISMTIGLLPIMGITLPFISYGGSSLLSYMILLGIIFNVSNESLRFTNK